MDGMPFKGYLTKWYHFHTNLERQEGDGSLSYLLKYAFKTQANADVQMQKKEESES